MKTPTHMPRLKGFRYPREIIACAVWAYHRFALSTADVEDLLAGRGVIVSREAIRLWVNRFGCHFANCIRRDRPRPNDTWHLDEVLEMPLSNYAASNYDRVELNGKLVGHSMFTGYTYNERTFISLAFVDPEVALGDEVILTWGEEGGGTAKRTVEPHKTTEVRVRTAPAPFSTAARETYVNIGWRTASVA